MGHHRTNNNNLVTHANFIDGHFLIVEDLTNSSLGSAEINGPSQEITIGVNGIFKTATSHNITCVLYYLLPKQFEINHSRVVENIT